MKQLNIIIFLISSVVISSCKSSQPVTETTASAPEITKDTLKAKALSGNYQGLIPCADCIGITMQLELHADFTYQEKVSYLGKSDSAFTMKGTYGFLKNGDLVLNKQQQTMSLLRPNTDGLLLLDKNNEVIKGDLAERYQLKRYQPSVNLSTTATIDQNNSMWKAEIVFYADDLRQNWQLIAGKDTGVIINSKEGLYIHVPYATPVRDSVTGSYTLHSKSGNYELKILIQPNVREVDTRRYAYQVLIQWKPAAESVFKNVGGVGNFTFNPELATRWQLMSVNGQKPDTAGLPKGVPMIELNLQRARLSGHDGCNLLSTNAEIAYDNMLITGLVASTKMACPNSGKSPSLSNLLSAQQFRYEIKNDDLELKSSEHTVLLFKKID